MAIKVKKYDLTPNVGFIHHSIQVRLEFIINTALPSRINGMTRTLQPKVGCIIIFCKSGHMSSCIDRYRIMKIIFRVEKVGSDMSRIESRG
jgi:hypothetical protein